MFRLLSQHLHGTYQIGDLEKFVINLPGFSYFDVAEQRIEYRCDDSCQFCLSVIIVYDDLVKAPPVILMCFDFIRDSPAQLCRLLDVVTAFGFPDLHAEIANREMNGKEIQNVEEMLPEFHLIVCICFSRLISGPVWIA